MSIEKELLLQSANILSDFKNFEQFAEKIYELLAQPEKKQEPTTRHALDSYWNQEAYQRGYAQAEHDLKREPLSDEEIDKGYQESDGNYYDLAFRDGVRFAEKHNGIGGGE